MLYNTGVSAREMQRDYKSIFRKANKEKKPVVVFAHNQPLGAVIGLDLLEKFQLEALLKQALDEFKKGKTRKIKSEEDIEEYLSELEQAVK